MLGKVNSSRFVKQPFGKFHHLAARRAFHNRLAIFHDYLPEAFDGIDGRMAYTSRLYPIDDCRPIDCTNGIEL